MKMSNTTYAIAVLRQAYQPDLQNLEQVYFIKIEGDQHDNLEIFDNLDDAEEMIDVLDSEIYVTTNGESGRPEYFIVEEDTADYIMSGRNSDMSNYNWDDCDCDKNDGDCCGECEICNDYMIYQDRIYIKNNSIN